MYSVFSPTPSFLLLIAVVSPAIFEILGFFVVVVLLSFLTCSLCWCVCCCFWYVVVCRSFGCYCWKSDLCCCFWCFRALFSPSLLAPQWGVADAELKRSPFKARSRSVYSHTCCAYCKGFLPCLFLPFQSIHLHFFQNLVRFFLCWLRLTHGSCVGPQNKIGHPAGGRFPCWMPAEYK